MEHSECSRAAAIKLPTVAQFDAPLVFPSADRAFSFGFAHACRRFGEVFKGDQKIYADFESISADEAYRSDSTHYRQAFVQLLLGQSIAQECYADGWRAVSFKFTTHELQVLIARPLINKAAAAPCGPYCRGFT